MVKGAAAYMVGGRVMDGITHWFTGAPSFAGVSDIGGSSSYTSQLIMSLPQTLTFHHIFNMATFTGFVQHTNDKIPGVFELTNGRNMHYFLLVMTTVRH